VEWPPSPWRLLRAFIAAGFARLGWKEVPDLARSVIEKLADVTPSYSLPSGQAAHTRHFMPIYDANSETTTKVLDTFIRFGSEDTLTVHWPADLSNDETALLEQLVQGLGYLGRAESWVEAIVTADAPSQDTTTAASRARPWDCLSVAQKQNGWESVPLLAPVSNTQYLEWRRPAIEAAVHQEEEKRGKKVTKTQREKITSVWPEDLIACLLVDTAFLQKNGWSQPPGSQSLLYGRRKEALDPRPPPAPRRKVHRPPVEAALLALSSDTPDGKLLPQMTRCLPQAEIVHQSLISILMKKMCVDDCPPIFGRDADGNKLEHGHQHAHFIPLDLDEDGRLDHFIIHAPMGLDDNAQRAITRLGRTWTKNSRHDIFVNCAGFGELDDFRKQLRLKKTGRPVPVIQKATVLESITPFVPSRFLKKKYTIQDHVRDELAHRGIECLESIEVFNHQGHEGREKLIQKDLLKFIRTRRKTRNTRKPQPPAAHAYGLRLRLGRPQGPVALGYASHFGLGLFAPVNNQ
jgi:CRISPR-associated protein Csb2